MYYDTHVHFDNESDVPGIIDRARAAGVEKIIAVGGTREMNIAAKKAAEDFPDTVRAAVGLDRSNVGKLGASVMYLESHAFTEGTVALGETGLDFHYDSENRDAQEALFKDHLDLALKLRIPVIVHCREAEDVVGRMIEDYAAAWQGERERMGVIHCFTGDLKFAERISAAGFYISFSGILTFRNADSLRAVAKAVPSDRLLVETDTPYLAPVPHRGSQNEPAYLPHTVRVLAEARECSTEEIAALTSSNARRLFGF